MPRYIDADALKRDLEIAPYNDYDDFLRTERLIDDAPTVDDLSFAIAGRANGKTQAVLDAVRPKGEWTYIGQSEVTGLKIVKCTNCHKRQYGSMDYCGNCGADMRKDGANMVTDLCSICKHGDNCERSDKGVSFANHSACWKFER